jgi:hypothetical protein
MAKFKNENTLHNLYEKEKEYIYKKKNKKR